MAMLVLSSTLTTFLSSAKFSTPQICNSSRSILGKAFAGLNWNLNLGVNFNFLTGNVLRVSSSRIVYEP